MAVSGGSQRPARAAARDVPLPRVGCIPQDSGRRSTVSRVKRSGNPASVYRGPMVILIIISSAIGKLAQDNDLHNMNS